MARADKVAAVAELTAEFRESSAAVLTEYRGLTVAQLAELRHALGENTTYSVVKNTLTKIAARDAGVEKFDDLLIGPSAIAFVKGDPVVAAKGLRDFARTHPLLVIKGGLLDGSRLDASELARLADLESREVLLAKLAGAMKAKTSQAAALFQAPLAQLARVVDALRAKVEESAPAGSADAAESENAGSDDTAGSDTADSDTSAEATTGEGTTDEATTGASEPAASTEDVPAEPVATTDEAPANEAPANEAPANDAPANEAPANEAPAEA
jgi:large subunit ribosomal protein L10